MIRDCIFDDTQNEAHMFWQPASFTTNLIQGGQASGVGSNLVRKVAREDVLPGDVDTDHLAGSDRCRSI